MKTKIALLAFAVLLCAASALGGALVRREQDRGMWRELATNCAEGCLVRRTGESMIGYVPLSEVHISCPRPDAVRF